MRCPSCGFDSPLNSGFCIHCNYKVADHVPQRGKVLTAQRATTQSALPKVRPFALHVNMMLRGRYRLLEEVAPPVNQREQGSIWLATDVRTNTKVVVRELAVPQNIETTESQFVQSIRTRLEDATRHTGTPTLLDVFKEFGANFFVFQYIEGSSLSTVIAQNEGGLPESTVAEYGRQICQILAFFANMRPPFIHGAVNPDMIVISPDGNYASLIMLPLFPPQSVQSESGYLAPEQKRGMLSPASDIYGLAATMHHALTGYDPRESKTYFRLPAHLLKPNISPKMEAILLQALRLSPAQRYAHPYNMHKDLTALVAEAPKNTSPQIITGMLRDRQTSQVLTMLQARNRRLQNILVGGLCAVLILSVAAAAFLRTPTFGPSPSEIRAMQRAELQKELTIEAQTYQQQRIGLSDGRFALDTYPYHPQDELDLKKQAGQAVQQGKIGTAMQDLEKAIAIDPTDAEARIYDENLRITQQKLPYVTFVVGESIDGEPDDQLTYRADLQAISLVQHDVNQQHRLPNGLQLRIMVGGSGPDDNGATTVAQMVRQRVLAAGNPDHIVAIIGWSSDKQTLAARNVLNAAHVPLPVVSQKASSIDLSRQSQYFFRMIPPDDVQGRDAAMAAMQIFNAKRVLVLRDPTDQVINLIGSQFAQTVKLHHGSVIDATFTHKVTTVDDYQKMLQKVFTGGQQAPDFIFTAGANIDAIPLAHAYGILARAFPAMYPANLKIMGNNDLNSSLVLGQRIKDSQALEAMVAADFPQDMQRLVFPAFTNLDEWTVEHVPTPPLLEEWNQTYQQNPTIMAPDPNDDSLLTYDAMNMVVKAVSAVHGTIDGQAVSEKLAAFGQGKTPAYQGVTGRLLFDGRGNPVDRAMMVVGIEADANGNNVIKTIQAVGTYA